MERGLARNTTLAYASDLEQFLAHLERRGQDPLKASRSDLEDYLWELKSQKGLEASSLFRKIEALRSFYFFQAAERRIPGGAGAGDAAADDDQVEGLAGELVQVSGHGSREVIDRRGA